MEEKLNKIVEVGVLAETQSALNEIALKSGRNIEDVVKLYERAAKAGVSPKYVEKIVETVQSSSPADGE